MKLYLLEREDGAGWDEYNKKLIRAESEARAREIANLKVGDEGKIWNNSDKREPVTCKIIEIIGDEGEIIADFHAG